MRIDKRREKTRPLGVWLISVYCMLTGAWTLFTTIAFSFGLLELSREQREYFDSVATIDWLISIATLMMLVCSAAALFLYMRIASLLFALTLALGVAYAWMNAQGNPVHGPAQSPGIVIHWAILLIAAIYASNLRRRRVLS